MAEVDVLVNYETVTSPPKEDIPLRDRIKDDKYADVRPSAGWSENYENVNKSHVSKNVEQTSSANVDATVPQTSNLKKKHRRRKSQKRRWKPYYKLTWDEKKEKDDRETKRANRKHEQRFAHGQPVAPYNTTQFLMEDHKVKSPDYLKMRHNGNKPRANKSVDSSEEYYSSPEDEEEFMQREFRDTYDVIHAERLESMSKNELIQEYLQLEDRVDKLESKLKMSETSVRSRTLSTCTIDSEVQTWDMEDDEETEKIRIFQEEIRKLAHENVQLKEENKRLRTESESLVDDVDEEIAQLDVGSINSNEDILDREDDEQSDIGKVSIAEQYVNDGEQEPSSSISDTHLQDQRNFDLSENNSSHSFSLGQSSEQCFSASVSDVMDESANDGFVKCDDSPSSQVAMQCWEVSSAGDLK